MQYSRLIGVMLLAVSCATNAQGERGVIKAQPSAFVAGLLRDAQAAQRKKRRETVEKQMYGATREEMLIEKVFPKKYQQKTLQHDTHKAQVCAHRLYNQQLDGRNNYARRGNKVKQPPRKGARHSHCS